MNTTPNNITDLFFEQAEICGEKPAIIFGDKEISFVKLKKEVIAAASYFHKKGIKKGDRVLVFVPMSINLYRDVLALFYVGAVAVFLDEWVSLKRLNLCCVLADCKGFIAPFGFRWLGNILSSEIRKIPLHFTSGAYTGDAGFTITNPTIAEDVALITFTTGSTGTPKAASRSHAFLHEQFKILAEEISTTPDEVCMTTLPIVLLIQLGTGNTSVIANFSAKKPQKLKPIIIIDAIKKFGVNTLIASPYFIKRIAEEIMVGKISSPPQITKIFSGGAPVFPMEAALFESAFPKASIKIVFGSTEAEPISLADAMALKNKSLAHGLWVGNIHPQTRLKIIPISEAPISVATDDALNQMALPLNEIGEILVAGNHVLKSYFNSPDAFKQNKIVTAETTWHRTGDSGFVDEKNELFLTGGCTTLIYRNGQVFSPFILEGVLQKSELIAKGTLLENNHKIYVVAELKKRNAIQQDIKTELEILAPALAKYIDEIITIKAIPRDPRHNSKIDYAVLRKMVFGVK